MWCVLQFGCALLNVKLKQQMNRYKFTNFKLLAVDNWNWQPSNQNVWDWANFQKFVNTCKIATFEIKLNKEMVSSYILVWRRAVFSDQERLAAYTARHSGRNRMAEITRMKRTLKVLQLHDNDDDRDNDYINCIYHSLEEDCQYNHEYHDDKECWDMVVRLLQRSAM